MGKSDDLGHARLPGNIDGLSLAVVENGEIVERVFGYGDQETQAPVTARSVFRAASLGKPVFSYAVLKLVDQGVISLDTTLAELENFAPGDPLAVGITAAHVLSHTTGFPNWRTPEEPLRAHFRPGERFSYSGEGYLFLQRALERLTGESLDAMARRLVFEPLGMTRSTFDPAHIFDDEAALSGKALKSKGANAAASFRTTARDYARFLKAVLAGEGLRPTTSRAWMEPRTRVPANFVNTSDPRRAHQTDPDVAWGLGWGLETKSDHFFQWGANNGYVSFAIGSRTDQAAFVLLTTGFTGLEGLGQLVERVFPGPRASLAWLARRTDL